MTAVPAINIGMSAKDRENISNGLSRVLAESFLLYVKTHNYHWNVKGPMFQTLHVMFEEQYTELWTAMDAIAERIRSLGFPAPGTLKEYLKLATIKELEGVPSAEDMIRDVLAGSETVSRLSREVMALADAAGDDPTADLLTQRMQVHEKNAWMLRSLIDHGAAPAAPASKAKKK
ncbi:MAG: DNA starvation/stationary phase protection protein [Alistipes senegalensis]|nr:DNA starvation/stationary phase protection protein [Oxalobacter formigenes]MCM1280367.1 DNA starvation/stationary phase protection protein [Alistipes senegalensis]